MSEFSEPNWQTKAIAIAIANCFAMPAANAASIDVDGTNCTLIQAIQSANSDTSIGGCTAGSGDDVLNLQTNLSYSTVYSDYSALPAISTPITINGNGNTVSRSGGDQLRLFNVTDSTATFNNLTISNGDVDDDGGAISISNSTVTLNNSTLSNNSATYYGGAIDCVGLSSTLTLNSVTLSNNLADYSGGGIYSNGCSTQINNSNLSNNIAPIGGGVYLTTTSLTVNNSTVSSNIASAGRGGGVYASIMLDNVQISASTVSGNSASNEGGGIFVDYADLTITDSTISNNENNLSAGGASLQTYGGGGVLVRGDQTYTLSILNSTLSGNTSGHIGGAVVADGIGDVAVTQSTITGSKSDSDGALYVLTDGNLTVSQSLLSQNTSENNVGAIFVDSPIGGIFLVDQSAIVNNVANKLHGGIYANRTSSVVVSNSTVSGNTSVDSSGGGSGGGLSLGGSVDSLTVLNSTFVDNQASSYASGINIAVTLTELTVANSIISSSSARDGCLFESPASLSTTFTNNWFEDASCDGVASGVAPVGALMQLGARAYGHRPLDSALSAGGDITVCAAPPVNGVDQLGEPRQATQCSIGSIDVGDSQFWIIRASNGAVITIPL